MAEKYQRGDSLILCAFFLYNVYYCIVFLCVCVLSDLTRCNLFQMILVSLTGLSGLVSKLFSWCLSFANYLLLCYHERYLVIWVLHSDVLLTFSWNFTFSLLLLKSHALQSPTLKHMVVQTKHSTKNPSTMLTIYAIGCLFLMSKTNLRR